MGKLALQFHERLAETFCQERHLPALYRAGALYQSVHAIDVGGKTIVAGADVYKRQHIGIGIPWDLDRNVGGVTVLPPYERSKGSDWYTGTANAIYQNLEYMETYNPEYVLILSGDHIYKMDYEVMLEYHKANNADITIAAMPVPIEEASRFGIVITDDKNQITEFEEKPAVPRSNLASMGIYIFSWPVLRDALIKQMCIRDRNIIPLPPFYDLW